MSDNIQIKRISIKLKEMYEGLIDMTDVKPSEKDNHKFETRSIAALGLMMRSNLTNTTSSLNVTDGFNDLGIDAIFLDETQLKLFVVQSKWRNDGCGSVSHKEMMEFVDGIKRIINYDIDGANPKIQAKKNDIDLSLNRMGYRIHAIFIHTGNQEIKTYDFRPMQELLDSTNDDVETLIEFEEISYKDIYSYLANGQDSENIVLDDVLLSYWGKIDSPYTSYYGTISAALIGSWYAEYGDRLFEKNIRYYKGDTEVNEGIKKVLLNEPEAFYYYNNGIKLLCKEVHRKIKEASDNKMGLFSLKGVSLVNGAQTTGSIGNAFKENPDQVSKAYVMIQIIDLSEVSEDRAIQITKLSNTQNKIENRDFVALDPSQEKIRQDLSFSHFTYLYKSGDKIIDPETQLSFDEAIVALACLYDDVSYSTLAKRNVGALSDDIKKAPYKTLINCGTNSYTIINSVLVVRLVEKFLLAKRTELTGKEKLISIHANRFIAHCVLQKIKIEDGFFTSVLDKDSLKSLVSTYVDSLITPISDALNELYSESYPASIFKNASKCKTIKFKIAS